MTHVEREFPAWNATEKSVEEKQMWIRSTAGRVGLCITGATLMAGTTSGQERLVVASPDGRNVASVEVREGRLVYGLWRDGRSVFMPSGLGVQFRAARSLRDGLGRAIRFQPAN